MQSSGGAIVEAAAITASRALASDTNGIPVASATTATELGFVSGVTSAIQTQLNAKQATGNYVTALTGDVTATGPGSVAATIAANAVTNAKSAQMATLTIKGNNTGITANAADLTVAQVNAILPVFTSALNGIVPSSGGGTTNFLRADGTWAAAGGGSGTVTSVSVTTANGVSGSVATATTTPAITLTLGAITPTSVNGASSTEIGYLVGVTSSIQTQLNAKQATGNYVTALTGDVTATGPGSVAATIAANAVTNAKAAQMATLTIKGNNTGGTANASDLTVAQVNAILPVFTSALNGITPASGGGTTNFLRADGTWAVPAGGGGGTPGGANTQVQFNNSGAFGGSSAFTFNNTSGVPATSTGFLDGYATTATAGGTTTLTVSSAKIQFFTGTSNQTVQLPVVSTLTTGQKFSIFNNSTGIITVNSSGGNTIQALAAGSMISVFCISTSGTGVSSWSQSYIPPNIMNNYFGSGGDGALTFSSGVTGINNTVKYYSSITISGTARLQTTNCLVFCSGVCDLTNAPADAITNAPGNLQGGNGGNTGTAGTAGVPQSSASLGSGTAGTAGGAGGTGAGAQASLVANVSPGFGGSAGNSGAGGTSGGNAGGASRSGGTVTNRYTPQTFAKDLLYGGILRGGGGGGGGGGSGGGDGTNAGGGGGGGGSAGGIVFLSAAVIARGGSTAAGAISCPGGAGGNGGSPTAGNASGGGGGAGAGAGAIYVAYGSLTGTTATNAIRANGGTGGNGGNGFGTGGGGSGGGGGSSGSIVVINLGNNITTVTASTTGTAGSAASGSTGGAGGAGATSQQSL
jgi:hypothetical protein